MDAQFDKLRAEVPYLKRKPSEYLKSHFWFTTQPIEEPERPEYFAEFLEHLDMSDHLLFSSDYPHTEGGRDPIARFESCMANSSAAEVEKFRSGNFLRVFQNAR